MVNAVIVQKWSVGVACHICIAPAGPLSTPVALLAGQKGVYRVLQSGALYVPAVLFAVVANIYVPHPLSSVPTRLAS